MPLYLFMVSNWPRFSLYLRCRLPVKRVEDPWQWVQVPANIGLSGSRLYPERDMCSAGSTHSIPVFRTSCLFVLQDTHIHTHTPARRITFRLLWHFAQMSIVLLLIDTKVIWRQICLSPLDWMFSETQTGFIFLILYPQCLVLEKCSTIFAKNDKME